MSIVAKWGMRALFAIILIVILSWRRRPDDEAVSRKLTSDDILHLKKGEFHLIP